MKVKYHSQFDCIDGDERSEVFEVFPDVFSDGRGSFAEVLKTRAKDASGKNVPDWFLSTSWIKQINRSTSIGKVVRGCHAQKQQWCQAKLVQALTQRIYDVIVDARPNSSTFGASEVILLDPAKQNQLFVPRGFLHAFATIADEAPSLFEYYCDNVYCKESEVGVNPMTILPSIAKSCKQLVEEKQLEFSYLKDFVQIFEDINAINLSDKDLEAPDYEQWMRQAKEEYMSTGSLWYC